MAGLSGASGRRCSISGVRGTRQPVKPSLRPSPLTDTPWPRLLMSGGGVWLVSWPGCQATIATCIEHVFLAGDRLSCKAKADILCRA